MEELVGQLLLQERRENLDSGAVGLFVFLLVNHYGDKQPTINSSGSRLVECVAQSETRMREHMSLCERMTRFEETHNVDRHQQLLLQLQREAPRNAMAVRRQQIASRACRSASCVSKAVTCYLVQQKVPETLVSEIVRPSPEAAELLSVSALLAGAATRERETW